MLPEFETNSLHVTEKILYQIVFDASLTGEYEHAETKQRFQKAFGLDEKQLARVFSGNEIILKSHIPEEMAMHFAIKIAEAGCECQIETVPDPEDLSLQPGFVERRKAIRRIRYRREARSSSIVPDRRSLRSRRKLDLILLEKDGDFPGNTVGQPQSTR